MLGIEPKEERVLKHGQLFDLTEAQLLVESVLVGPSDMINYNQQQKWNMDTLYIHVPTIDYGKLKVDSVT